MKILVYYDHLMLRLILRSHLYFTDYPMMIFIAKGSGLELHVGVHYRVFSLFFEQFFSFSWPFRMDIFEEYRSVILQNVTLCGFVL